MRDNSFKRGVGLMAAIFTLATLGCQFDSSPLETVSPGKVTVPRSTTPGQSPVEIQAVQRPISDFLDAQGSTNIFVPPVPDYIGWVGALASPPARFASVQLRRDAGLLPTF